MGIASYQPASNVGHLAIAHLHGFHESADEWFCRSSANGRVQAAVSECADGWFFMTVEPTGDVISTDRRRGTLDGALRHARYWLAEYNARHGR